MKELCREPIKAVMLHVILWILGGLFLLVVALVSFFVWYIKTPDGDRLMNGGGTPETFRAKKEDQR